MVLLPEEVGFLRAKRKRRYHSHINLVVEHLIIVIDHVYALSLSYNGRGSNGAGLALLFLLPEEVGFLRYLRQTKVHHAYTRYDAIV